MRKQKQSNSPPVMVPVLGLLAVQVSAITFIFFLREERYYDLLPLCVTIPVAAAVLYRYQKESRRGAWLCGAMILAGAMIFLRLPVERPVPEEIEKYRHGRITKAVFRGSHTFVAADLAPPGVSTQNTMLRAALYVEGEKQFIPGSIITIEKPCLPLKGETPGQRYLTRQGFICRVWLNEKQVRIKQTAAIPWRLKVRNEMGRRISHLFNRKNGGILRGLYFGNRHFIDGGTLFHFHRSGLLHLLAASGLHVAMIASLPLFLCCLFPAGTIRRYLPALGTVLFYIWLTDLPPSLLRAGMMFSLFVMIRLAGMERNIFSILFFTAFIMLYISPEDIFGTGFHLSFGATLGILLFYKHCSNAFSFFPPLLRNPLAVSLAAQCIAAPIIFLTMGEATPGGLLNNLVIMPLVTAVLYGSLCSLGLSLFFPDMASAGAAATGFIMDIMRKCVEILQLFSGHGSFHHTPLLLLIPVMPLILLLIPRKAKIILCSAGIMLLLLPLPFLAMEKSRPSIQVISSKVCRLAVERSGDGTVICGFLPRREGVKEVMKFLANTPLTRLHLVIPNPDWKNLKNWQKIAVSLPVHHCTLGPGFDLSGTTEKFITLLKRKGAAVEFFNFPPCPARNRDNFSANKTNSIDSNHEINYIYNTLKQLRIEKIKRKGEKSKKEGPPRQRGRSLEKQALSFRQL